MNDEQLVRVRLRLVQVELDDKKKFERLEILLRASERSIIKKPAVGGLGYFFSKYKILCPDCNKELTYKEEVAGIYKHYMCSCGYEYVERTPKYDSAGGQDYRERLQQ
jgi:hypothetical protein